MPLDFTEKQKKGWDILTDPSGMRILFDGGSRSGKTILLTEYMVMRAFQFPVSRQLMARKHRSHAEQSLWNDTLKNYLSKNIPSGLYRREESKLTVSFYNGSQIIVGGLDDSDRTEKILGNEYITILLNEATQLSWETVQMAITRLAQSVKDDTGGSAIPKLLLDCNPRGPRHWLHKVGINHIDPESGKELPNTSNWSRLHWSAYDNKENLPAEYLKSLETLPDVMKDRMLNGLWRNNEGAVYDEFDEDTHVVPPFEIPKDWQRFRAIDFGYTNPFVCLWGALDNDGRLYLYKEHYQAQERTIVHAGIIKKLSKDELYLFTTADHDASERAELEAQGIFTKAAIKDVSTGIQSVKNRLTVQADGKPRLLIFSTLKNTLSEIYDYSWSAPRDGVNAKEEPVKLNDHAMDCMRYMVMGVEQGHGGLFASKYLINRAAV